jgi:cell division protein FtsB
MTMRDRREQDPEEPAADERHVLIGDVEVIDPETDQSPEDVTPGELLALLVAHFEESLIRKEHELIALRRTLEDTERSAVDIQHALQQELETVNQVNRILERENHRLTAEIEALRSQIETQPGMHDMARRYQDLERENQRLIAEIEALRRQSSDASQTHADELLLETLLATEVGAPSNKPSYRWSAMRRFRKRIDTA